MSRDNRAALNWVLTIASCFLMGWFVRGADWLFVAVAVLAFLISLTLPEVE